MNFRDFVELDSDYAGRPQKPVKRVRTSEEKEFDLVKKPKGKPRSRAELRDRKHGEI